MIDNHWHMEPNKDRAIMLARRQLSELVCDAVNLEGINFMLPEIQTLLDGITVGGHKLSDQKVALNQRKTWRELFEWLVRGEFELSARKTCQLHAIAAKDETLGWGRFMMNGLLLGAGFPAINLPSKRQLEFNRLMLVYYKTGIQQPMN